LFTPHHQKAIPHHGFIAMVWDGFPVVRSKLLSIDDSLKINYFMFNLRPLKNKKGVRK